MKESERNISLEKQIDAYVKGNLSEEQADEMWAELLKHPKYINYMKTEIDLARLYQQEEEGSLRLVEDDDSDQQKELPSENAKTKKLWWISAAAAAVILAVVLTNVFLTNRQTGIRQWANQKIALATNLASTPVVRSTGNIAPPDSLLNAGFKAAIDGNTQKAIEIYQLVVNKYTDPKVTAKAKLNLGILQYNNSKFKVSIQHFTDALATTKNLTLLKERAYWYMGNAFININKLKKAKKAIQKAYSIGKIYKREEAKLLKRLNNTLKTIAEKGLNMGK